MYQLPVQIQSIRLRDMPAVTRMVYQNMTGVDEYFTQLTRSRLGRWTGYLLLPVYLWLSGRGYKATVNGELIGCAYLYRRQLSGYVFNVNVDHGYRRRGVGRQLMAHVEQQVRQSGLSWVALHVDRSNRPAQNLYRRLSYKPYHATYLQRRLAAPIPHAVEPELRMRPLDGQWRFVFQEFAALERQQGDSWAAEVVGREYKTAPPTGGRHWRCSWVNQDAGYVWADREEGHLTLLFLLYPQFWGHPITQAVVRSVQAQLLDQGAIELYLGSQAHYEKAAVCLKDLGFEPETKPRILMLKRVGPETSN